MRERRTEARLVGRDAEVGRIAALALDATVGAVLLTGPTGVGTSRLAEGALVHLADVGWRGVGVSATGSAARIAYGSLSELIPDTLDGLLGGSGDGAGSIDLVVLRAVESALGLDEDRPVVVVIDDVAAVDRASCELFVHLAANRRLFLIGVQGASTGVDEALRRLTPASVVELPIEPFPLSATAELAVDLLGGGVDPGLVRSLHERSQGFPAFVRELVTAGVADGRIVEIDGVAQLEAELGIGPSLGRQILFRLGLLSAREQEVLELLAVAGELGVEELASAGESDLLEGMERRGLVATHTSGRRLRVAHRHPLHAEAVLANLTTLARRRRHRELAALVARQGRRVEDRVLGALASIEAGEDVDVEVLLEAVTGALRSDRIRDAGRLAAAAHDRAGSERTAAALAETLIRAGRFIEADRLLAGPSPGSADDWQRLRRAIRRSSNQLWGFRNADEALRIDEACMPTLGDPQAVDRVIAHQAWIDYSAGRPAAALRRSRPLADHPHPDVRFAHAVVHAPALVLTGSVDDGVALAQRAWDEGWGTDTEYGSHGQHLISIAFGALYRGEVATARFVTEQAIAHCRDRNEIPALLFFLDLAAHTELLVGDLPLARTLYEEALAIGIELAIGASVRSSLAGLTLAIAQLGLVDEAQATWRRLDRVPEAPGPRGDADVRAADAWVRAVAGDPTEGARILADAARDASADGRVVHQLLLHLDRARLGYADDDDVRLAGAASAGAQGPWLPALAEVVAGAARNDAAALDTAASTLDGLGFSLWSAEFAARAADAWSSGGERRAAVASQRAADEYRTATPAARTPSLARAAAVEPLTRREREIAMMAAGGARNREIADRLHVSVRTVETHLGRIYRKLGIDGRGALADVMGGGDDV